MNKQKGMVTALLLVVLAAAAAVLSYLYWDAQKQRVAVEQDVTQLRTMAKNNRDEVKAKNIELSEQRAENFTLTQELNRLKSELSQREQNAQAATEKEQQLQAEVARLNGEVASAVENLTATNEAQAEQLAAAEKALAEKDTQIATLTQQHEEATKNQAEFQANMVAQNNLLQQQVDSLTKSLDEKDSESTALNQQYLQARNQLESERNLAMTVTQQLEGLEQQLLREKNALDELQSELGEISSENASLNQANESLSKTNEQLSLEKEQLVKQYKDGITVIRIPDRVLFDSGSAQINDRGEKTLALLAKALASFPGHLVSVEGHTDKRPIGSALAQRYPSNWELSSARASSAIRLFVEKGLPAGQFQAVGFGETRPLLLGEEPEQLRQNRRIEILLLPPIERQQKQLSLSENMATQD